MLLLLVAAGCSSGSRPSPSADVPDTRVSVDVGVPAGEDVAPDTGVEDVFTGCTSNAECDDGNPCTRDICQIKGQCVHTPLDGVCDDDDACTVDDSCQEGQCVGTALVCEEDEDPCTVAVCESSTGCTWACADLPGCVLLCERDDDCDDDDPESLDSCVRLPCSSECRHSWPGCDDGNPCTVDYRADGGACAHSPLTGEPCDDGSACTIDDRCQQELCVGLAVSCDDGNSCTSDYCDRETGCQHQERPDGLACDDGLVCTAGDTCYDGVCRANAVVCPDDDDPCTLNDVCVEPFGCDVDCGEAEDCRRDLCDADADCTDASLCKVGRCVQNFCHGHCLYDVDDDCDDGDLCTLDSCNPATGCQHERVCQPCIVDAECDDDDACTIDRCGDDSLCRYIQVECPDDGNRCTDERCDAELGCTYVCLGCAGGSPYCNADDDERCDDGDPCTVDVCADGPCGRDCRNEPLVCAQNFFCDDPSCFEGNCLHSAHAATPSTDGIIGEDWHPDSQVVESSFEPVDGAFLGALRLQYDDESLYVGVTGDAPASIQAIVGYIDIDLGSVEPGSDIPDREPDPTGIRYTQYLPGVGALDEAIAGGVAFAAQHVGIDFAFGTVGMASAFGEAEKAGWRVTNGDTFLLRVPGSAVLTNPAANSLEAVIPLSALWPDGIPGDGARMAIVVLLLLDIDARCPEYAAASLPRQDEPWPAGPAEPEDVAEPVNVVESADVVDSVDVTQSDPPCPVPLVTTVYEFVLQPEQVDCCESDTDCRDGDPCTRDICTVGGLCTHVFAECD